MFGFHMIGLFAIGVTHAYVNWVHSVACSVFK
jgi:hypothetical protein